MNDWSDQEKSEAKENQIDKEKQEVVEKQEYTSSAVCELEQSRASLAHSESSLFAPAPSSSDVSDGLFSHSHLPQGPKALPVEVSIADLFLRQIEE